MTTGTTARVFGIYALAVPFCVGLAAWFPGYVAFDQETQLVSVSATLPQIVAAFAFAYSIIGAVFAKWGIKR